MTENKCVEWTKYFQKPETQIEPKVTVFGSGIFKITGIENEIKC